MKIADMILNNRAPIVVLSYFDALMGPTPFIIHPESPRDTLQTDLLQNIASHMDVHREDDIFQICYGNENVNALSLIFHIRSEWARGMQELCMVSLLDVGCNNLIGTYRYFLLHLKDRILNLEDGFMGFYANNFSKLRTHPEIKDINQQVRAIIKDFYDSLPKVFGKQKIELAIFGLHQSGKNSIMKRIQKNKLSGKYAIIQNIDIIELALRGTSFLTFTPSESSPSQDLKEICAQTDAIVVVIDSTDVEKFPRVQQLLLEIFNATETQGTPIAILNNKTDQKGSKQRDEIRDLLKLSKINRSHWDIFDISAMTGDGLDPALNWIIAEFSNLHLTKKLHSEGSNGANQTDTSVDD